MAERTKHPKARADSGFQFQWEKLTLLLWLIQAATEQSLHLVRNEATSISHDTGPVKNNSSLITFDIFPVLS